MFVRILSLPVLFGHQNIVLLTIVNIHNTCSSTKNVSSCCATMFGRFIFENELYSNCWCRVLEFGQTLVNQKIPGTGLANVVAITWAEIIY